MDLASLFNAPTEVTGPDGSVHNLREPTGMQRGMFQRWLEGRAREAAGRATDLPPEEQRQLLRDVNTDIAVGLFTWGGAACVQALQTTDGISKLYQIVLGVPLETAEKIVEKEKAEKVAQMTAVMAGGTDEEKKGLRSLLTSLGLGADFLNAYSSSNSATPHSITEWTTSHPSLQPSSPCFST